MFPVRIHFSCFHPHAFRLSLRNRWVIYIVWCIYHGPPSVIPVTGQWDRIKNLRVRKTQPTTNQARATCHIHPCLPTISLLKPSKTPDYSKITRTHRKNTHTHSSQRINTLLRCPNRPSAPFFKASFWSTDFFGESSNQLVDGILLENTWSAPTCIITEMSEKYSQFIYIISNHIQILYTKYYCSV